MTRALTVLLLLGALPVEHRSSAGVLSSTPSTTATRAKPAWSAEVRVSGPENQHRSSAGVLASTSSTTMDPQAERLLRAFDDLMRGDSSQGRMTMRVKTKRFEREMTLETWSKGTEKSLIRILEPAKERGTATLKVGDKIWNYLPKIDRTIKVPGSMMSGSWMGSHFTNDDLVQESRYSEDFDCVLDENDEHWTVSCTPFEDAAIVWGLVTIAVRKADEMPFEVKFFDEDQELVRTMTYDDVRTVGGKRIPTRLRAVPADDPDEYTEVLYADLEFDVDIDDRMFSLQSLKK